MARLGADRCLAVGCSTAGAAAGTVFLAAFIGGCFAAFYFPAAFSRCALAALTAAHRFFVASMIRFRPAALSLRLGFGASCVGGSVAFLAAAHLLRCASAMAFLPAALIFFRFRIEGAAVAAASAPPPEIMAVSSAILASILRFCASNPTRAAARISCVNSCVGMSAFPSSSLAQLLRAGSGQMGCATRKFRDSEFPTNPSESERRETQGPAPLGFVSRHGFSRAAKLGKNPGLRPCRPREGTVAKAVDYPGCGTAEAVP
jgi:hypothetical protein